MIVRLSGRSAVCVLLAVGCMLSGCSGGGSTPGPRSSGPTATPNGVTGPAADAIDTPGPVSGTVALPAGSKIALNTLTVRTSVGTAAVAANGNYSVQGFPNGHALATVLLPNGDPVLFGFIGPNATTIDATSTADVLGFYACDAFVLTPDVRAQAPALVAAAPGFGALTSAVANAVAASADPLGAPNASITQALKTYVGSIEAAAAASENARESIGQRGREAITISPVGASTGSGVNLIQEFPDGVHFLNSYRRRAAAEIDRVSYVLSGSTTPVPAPTRLTATPLPVLPVNGTNAGLISSVDDIFNSYFNNAANPSAYAPVTSSSIALPLVAGASKTTYLVTLLGPGAHLGTFLSLDNADATIQFNTELYYYIVDLAIPFITTVVLPLEADAVDKALATKGGADVISELLSDGGTLVPQLQADFQPDAHGHIDSLQALNDATRNLLENPAYTTTVEGYIAKTVELNLGSAAAPAIEKAFGRFNTIVEGFDYGLAAFDATVVGRDLLASNEADQYTVIVVPDKLTLTPPSQTLTGVTTGALTATDLSDTGSDAVPLQYTWSNTGSFGHVSDGIAGHIDSFTSTHATVTYTPTGSASGTDTVTVHIATLQSPNAPSQPIGSPPAATVTVQQPSPPPGTVALTPRCVYFTGTASGTQQFTAIANVPQGKSIQAYQWSIMYSANVNASLDVPDSSIVSSNGSLSVYSSQSNTATLNVGPATGTYILQVGVQVIYAPAQGGPFTFSNADGVEDDCPAGSPNPS